MNIINIKKKLNLIIFLLISILSIGEVYSIEPDVFVQSTVNRASKALSENISKQQKIEKLKIIAKETVDIKGIGLYTIGSFIKEISDEQKKQYTLLFNKYFLKSFSSRLAEYSNPEIEVKSKKVINEKPVSDGFFSS